MVTVVSGSGLGLFNSSLHSIKNALGFSHGTAGQAQGRVYANITNGNLIVQFQDEQLSGVGLDLLHTRTYNANGQLTDADADNWRWDGEATLAVFGSVGAAGSYVERTSGDGHITRFNWSAANNRYVCTDGAGAHDSVELLSDGWTYTEGSSRVVERYNNDLRLAVRQDQSGNTVRFNYDGQGRLLSIEDTVSQQKFELTYRVVPNTSLSRLAAVNTYSLQDINGVLTLGAAVQQVSYDHDQLGRLIRVTTDLAPGSDNRIDDGKIYVTLYSYHGDSLRLRTISQSDGTEISFDYYDAAGANRLKTISDGSGTQTFVYHNGFTRVVDANSNSWDYYYDSVGLLTKVVSPQQATQQFDYDAQGNVIRTQDARGNSVNFYYDENGNCVLERDALGHVITRTFNTNNQTITETRFRAPDTDSTGPQQASGGETQRYVYDAKQRLRYTVSAEGHVSENVYNSVGHTIESRRYVGAVYAVSGLGESTGLSESQLDQWKSALSDKSLQQLISFTYDQRGNLQSKTAYATVDSNGTGLVSNANTVTRYIYDQHGILLQAIVVRGERALEQQSYAYDGMGRVIGRIDATGTTSYVYDDANRQIRIRNEAGLTTTQYFDARGRLVSVGQSANDLATRTRRYFYNDAGQLRMTEDELGQRSFVFYDAEGRVSYRVDNSGAVTALHYNAASLITEKIAYSNTITSSIRSAWVVDGVVTKATLTVGSANADVISDSVNDRVERSEYDNSGRLVTQTDADGLVSVNRYDGLSRLIRKTTDARTLRYFYDQDSRLVATLDAAGFLTENHFDAAGRTQKITRYSRATALADRASGSLAQLKANLADATNDLSSHYFYDGQGRVIAEVDEQHFLTETTFDESAATQTTRRYDRQVNVSGIDTPATLRAQAGNATITAVITFDDRGRVSRRTNAEGTVTEFEYDSAGRICREVQARAQTEVDGTAAERGRQLRYNAANEVIGELSGKADFLLTTSVLTTDEAYAQHGVRHRYDDLGRRVGSIDANGNQTRFYYDEQNQLRFRVNADGSVIETQYTTFGQVARQRAYSSKIDSTTLASLVGGAVSQSLINTIGSLANATQDRTVSYQYNQRGQLTLTTDAEGFVSSNRYNQMGELFEQSQTISSSSTVTTRFAYDHRGYTTHITRDLGGNHLVTQTEYDAFGRVTATLDALGKRTTTHYEQYGRVVVITDPTHSARRTEIDAFGRTLKTVDSAGNATTFSYDNVTRGVTVTSPEGASVTTYKSRHGETVKVQDARGNVSTYHYDRNGQLITSTDALGNAIQQEYDNAGRLVNSTDARGSVTHFQYDAMNRVIERIVDPSGLNLRQKIEFTSFGQQWRISDGYGSSSERVTEYSYDRKGQRLRMVQDPNGLKLCTTFSYDGVGNQLTVTRGDLNNPVQQATRYDYDKLNRRIAETLVPSSLMGTSTSEPRDLLTQFRFDAVGRLTRKIDANGNSSWYVYNDAGELQFAIDAEGAVTETHYDSNRRVTCVRRFATRIATAGFGDNVATLNPISDPFHDQETRYVYDKTGRQRYLLQAIDAGNYRVTESVFDNNNNIIETRVYDRVISLAQLSVGLSDGQLTDVEMQTALDNAGYGEATLNTVRRSRFVYDVNNRLRFTIDTLGNVSESQFDSVGNAIKSIRHAAPVSLLTYSESSLVAAVNGANPMNRVTQSIYDAAGRLRFVVDADHAVAENRFDALNRVVKQVHYANRIADRDRYELSDFDGLANTVSLHNREAHFFYDAADRLRFSLTAGRQLHENIYDALGQLKETRQFDLTALTANWTIISLEQWRGVRAVGDGVTRGERYDYNSAGQLVRKTDAKNCTEQYFYDGAGNRVRFINKLSQQWDYRYNKIGQLVEQISPPLSFQLSNEASSSTRQLVTRFVYDTMGNLVERTEGIARNNDQTYNSIDARTTRFDYDRLGQQIRTIAPGYYDAALGRFERDMGTGRFQVSHETSYDTFGNAIRNRTRVANVLTNGQEDPANFVIRYKVYDIAGRLVYDVDALGYVTGSSYNAFGEAVTTTRYSMAIGSESNDGIWQRDEMAARVSNDTQARSIFTDYDAMGRKTRVTLSASASYYFSSANYSHDAPAAITAESAAPETLFDYNAFGDVVRERVKVDQSTYASTWHYYDSMAREVLRVDALGYGTKTEYDQHGNITATVEYLFNAVTPVDLNAAPPVFTELPSHDRRTEFSYDACNQQIEIRKRNISFAQWDGNSRNWTQQINQTVSEWRFQYDALGRQIARTDALGNTFGQTFDALGRVVFSYQPWHNVATPASTDQDPFRHQSYMRSYTRFTLDAFGNVIEQYVNAEPLIISFPLSTVTLSARNAVSLSTPSLTLDVINPGPADTGRRLRSKRDFMGNEIEITNAVGSVLRQQFNAANRLIKQTQDINTVLGNWQTTAHTLERRYEYDASGRQLAQFDVFNVYAFGVTLKYKSGTHNLFNAFGEVAEERRVWGQHNTALNNVAYAITASYRYDQAGHLMGKTAGDGETAYFYDLAGRVTRQEQRGNNNTSDGTGTRISETAYDILGRAVLQRLPSFSGIANALDTSEVLLKPKIRYSYDRWGNVIQQTDQAGNVTSYIYDKYNRLNKQYLPTEMAWRADGSSYQAAVTHELRYDVLGRVAETVDSANGVQLRKRVNEYDAAGHVVATVDATGVRREFAYDKFGQKIATRDGLGRVLVDSYYADGNVQVHGILRHTDGRTYNSYVDSEDIRLSRLNSYAYDAAGRKVAETDAASGSIYYKLDERSNVIASRNAANTVTTFSFDIQGRKTRETDALNNTQSWSYSNAHYSFGQVLTQNGGNLSYNDFGQLQSEYYASKNTTRRYQYLNNGLLASLSDEYSVGTRGGNSEEEADYRSTIWKTTYSYNNKGLIAKEVNSTRNESEVAIFDRVFDPETRTWEPGEFLRMESRISSTSATTLTAYDKLDRIATVQAPEALNSGRSYLSDLTYRYDELGNRRNIRSSYKRIDSNTSETKDYWYRYDNEGRVTLAKGRLDSVNRRITVSGAVEGTLYAYDGVGRRVMSDASTNTIYVISGVAREYYAQKNYSYNDLDRLVAINKRSVQRVADGNSDGALTSAEAWLIEHTASFDDRGFQISTERYAGIALNERTITDYAADGRVLLQTTRDKNNVIKSQVKYNLSNSYDAAGNLNTYQYIVGSGNGSNDKNYTVTYSYNRVFEFSAYRETSIAVTANLAGYKTGTTTNTLDYRGNLISSRIVEGGAVTTRNISYDRQGKIISKWEKTGNNAAKQQEYIYAANNAVANIGSLAAADFDYNDTPLSAQYPAAIPATYVIQSGDTLSGIALSTMGDARLWYVIADANSFTVGPTETLTQTGRSLRIPNVASNNSNSSTTIKPYNAADIIGNTVPSPIAPPPPSEKCRAATIAIVAVVAVAVSVITAGVLAPVMAGALGTVLGAMAVGAAAGAASSAAAQLTGMALHEGLGWGPDVNFSGKQMLSSALSGALTAGFTSGLGQLAASGSSSWWQQSASWLNGSGFTNTVARNTLSGGANYFVGQGVNYITRQDTSISWSGIAAAALSPNAKQLGGLLGEGIAGQFAQSFASGLSASAVNAVMTRSELGDIQFADIAAQSVGDAFGNVLGNQLVDVLDEWRSKPNNVAASKRSNAAAKPKAIEQEANSAAFNLAGQLLTAAEEALTLASDSVAAINSSLATAIEAEAADIEPQPITYKVKRGDNLRNIAKSFYGDAALWPIIALSNGIDDPAKVRNGKVLVIPNQEDYDVAAVHKLTSRYYRVEEKRVEAANAIAAAKAEELIDIEETCAQIKATEDAFYAAQVCEPEPVVITPQPQKRGYVGSNADILGVSEYAVDHAIANGETGVWAAAKYAGKYTGYKVWNFVTAGFVERHDERIARRAEGTLSNGNFWTATLIDGSVSVAAVAAPGKVSTIVTKKWGTGYAGSIAAGALSGASVDGLLQAGQMITYEITDGQTGQASFNGTEFAVSTFTGGTLGAAATYLGRSQVLNTKLSDLSWRSPLDMSKAGRLTMGVPVDVLRSPVVLRTRTGPLVGTSRAQMRAAARASIANDDDHMLRFLLNEDGNFKPTRGLSHAELIDDPDLVQMGHINSFKLGGQERLMLQGAWENQLNNISIETSAIGGSVLTQPAVDLGGIAVSLRTALYWESIGRIPAGTVVKARLIE